MKNILKNLSAVALMLTAVACSEQFENGSGHNTDVNLVELSFDAALDLAPAEVSSKTTYSDRSVYWEETDEINIFSGESWTKTEAGISSLAENRKTAVFTGLAAEGSGTYCSVYPKAEVNAFDGTSLTVSIPSEQTAVAGGFQSGANVAVSYTSINAFSFKNVGALIGFRFRNASDAEKTASVTFKARTSEDGEEAVHYGLSGNTTVTFDDAGSPVASEGSEKSVTLVAPEGGFAAATTYYIVVLPGNYKGLDITYNTTDGKSLTRSNDSDYDLPRNGAVNIGHLVEPYDILPEEINITLDFTKGNPFGSFPTRANQQKTGDRYTYKYDYEWKEEELSENFTFIFYKGAQGYYMGTKNGSDVLLIVSPNIADATRKDTDECCIEFPVIPGRYLSSVSVGRIATTGDRKVRLQEGYNPAGRYFTKSLAAPENTTTATPGITTWAFPLDGATGQITESRLSANYAIQFKTNGEYALTNISLTYTKTQPGTETGSDQETGE